MATDMTMACMVTTITDTIMASTDMITVRPRMTIMDMITTITAHMRTRITARMVTIITIMDITIMATATATIITMARSPKNCA